MSLKLSVLTGHSPLNLYAKFQISIFILCEMAYAQKLFHITFDVYLTFDMHLLGALIICSIKFEVFVFKLHSGEQSVDTETNDDNRQIMIA